MKSLCCCVVFKAAIVIALLHLSIVLSARGESPPDRSLSEALDAVANEDVKWDGAYGGLYPTLTGPAKTVVDADDLEVTDRLLEDLGDSSRFAVAHVLLTQLLHTGPEDTRDNSQQWFGMNVELVADGPTTYEQADMKSLKAAWDGILAPQASSMIVLQAKLVRSEAENRYWRELRRTVRQELKEITVLLSEPDERVKKGEENGPGSHSPH